MKTFYRKAITAATVLVAATALSTVGTGTATADVGVALTTDQIVAELQALPVEQLSALVRDFEPNFVIDTGPLSLPGIGASPEEFDVELTGPGNNKIAVIKQVRMLTNLGLLNPGGLIDQAPGQVLDLVAKTEVAALQQQLQNAGLTLTVN
ncbi:ribosomal protein bL12 [Kibdelosporangium phytohabitans]|uniref:Large ribosomal subunit protein bL12 C-terminal domain-containing protein n=1 Tax=Kibdelosporangium phytohabitans TaxID=860235 RepID=A0A0N9I176_9PSEU|nr:ribosomal protein L7/L12 [Kibdelosporangium phytohabitans]ALG08203.1 hypothetical protein AOZ06_15955 [Kibdelosporangium phytohabitans]MBE1470794.1 large subunit ribosomal protein L7/L12 [Kibdelosporangium phytohabitans]